MKTDQRELDAMSQHSHDQYAKEYLADLLDEVAKVQLGYEVLAEARRVDVYVVPRASVNEPYYQALGVLGRMTRQTCLLEPFRNPPSPEEVCQCLGKLFAVWHRLQLRQTRRKLPLLSAAELPFLWILSPTASKTLINGFGGQLKDDWCEGIHFLPSHFKTALVAIHQLPNTPETALLRVLGKDTKQTAAILELLDPQEWPADDPRNLLRQRVRSVLHAYLLSLQKQAGSTEEQETLMSLLALHEQWERDTLWKGRQEGRQEERREVVETLLKTRFGPDETLLQRLDLLLSMPLTELLPWLLTVSRKELLAKLELTSAPSHTRRLAASIPRRSRGTRKTAPSTQTRGEEI